MWYANHESRQQLTTYASVSSRLCWQIRSLGRFTAYWQVVSMTKPQVNSGFTLLLKINYYIGCLSQVWSLKYVCLNLHVHYCYVNITMYLSVVTWALTVHICLYPKIIIGNTVACIMMLNYILIHAWRAKPTSLQIKGLPVCCVRYVTSVSNGWNRYATGLLAYHQIYRVILLLWCLHVIQLMLCY